MMQPDIFSIEVWSVVWTVAFAVIGVSLGAFVGFLFALVFAQLRSIRLLCAFLRSIHELFWALLLIQVSGLGPTTGLLAIAIPYSGIFAKVFAEMIEEADLSAERVLPPGTSTVSRFAFARIPELAPQFWTYSLYRLECGMRSTLVLGFIGLPTIGFHLDSFFKQGNYAQAAALLFSFYLLIGSRRLWARPATVPLLIVASLLVLPEAVGGDSTLANLTRFVTQEIVPTPLRGADLLTLSTWANFAGWLSPIVTDQVVPGVIQTLVLSQIALAAMAIIALVLFPFICRRFSGRIGQPLGRIALVIVRSTPEYMLVYVLLQLLGPSMLPAIIALSLHNGRHCRLPDGPACGRANLPCRCAQRPQPVRLRDGPPALRTILGLCAVSLGDHFARERYFRHPGYLDARLLRRCGDRGNPARRCHGSDFCDGSPVDVRGRAIARAAAAIADRYHADPPFRSTE